MIHRVFVEKPKRVSFPGIEDRPLGVACDSLTVEALVRRGDPANAKMSQSELRAILELKADLTDVRIETLTAGHRVMRDDPHGYVTKMSRFVTE